MGSCCSNLNSCCSNNNPAARRSRIVGCPTTQQQRQCWGHAGHGMCGVVPSLPALSKHHTAFPPCQHTPDQLTFQPSYGSRHVHISHSTDPNAQTSAGSCPGCPESTSGASHLQWGRDGGAESALGEAAEGVLSEACNAGLPALSRTLTGMAAPCRKAGGGWLPSLSMRPVLPPTVRTLTSHPSTLSPPSCRTVGW